MSRGRKKIKSTGTVFRLNEAGMGEYERAGMAGLYLSLTAAAAWENQRRSWPLPEDIENKLDALRKTISNLDVPGFPLAEDGIGIRLEWPEGGEFAALKAIVEWAWQVHNGVFFLPGVHRKREHLDCDYLRLHVHNGLLETFFQFPRTIGKRRKPERKVVRFDEEKTFSVSYRLITTNELPQHKAVPRKSVCGDATASANSWIYPGSEPRFNSNPLKIQREPKWYGPVRFTYLMLLAPIACHYVKLPCTKAKNWSYMVMNVENLKEYQRKFLRRNMANAGNWPFHGDVSGLEDAALRYATHGKTDGRSLTVVMGKARYYHSGQKTRKNLLRGIALPNNMEEAFRRYDIFNRVFSAGNTAIPIRSSITREESDEKGNHFVALPNCRERITANILHGDPWYADLSYIPFWQSGRRGLHAAGLHMPGRGSISPERLWFLKLHLERKSLMALANEEVWHDPLEKDMLDAFREAFRRLLNREDEALSRGGDRNLPKRWNNVMDKWHRRLLHARTKFLLSTAIHELLAQASRSPNLNNGALVSRRGPVFLLRRTSQDENAASRRTGNNEFHAKFRRMVNDPNDWKRVRDLALLALATFTDRRLGQREDDESIVDSE